MSSEAESATPVRVAEVVCALSQALDLGSGSSQWHSVRACIIGMRIAAELRLSETIQNELYYALLLKDAGCSSNASYVHHSLGGSDDIRAKGDVKSVDWTRTNKETVAYALAHIATGKPVWERVKAIVKVALHQTANNKYITAVRCERGATLARLMGLAEGTAAAIAALDEHWDGKGNPEGLKKREIPLSARIMLLAQTLDVFYTTKGMDAALAMAEERSGRWFDPELVRAAGSLQLRGRLDAGLGGAVLELALDMEPQQKVLADGHVTLDAICQAFAQIVDAKSPFTQNHSHGVANAAVAIARELKLDNAEVLFIRHAALLHDLGKMAVSNAILEKPGKLDAQEWIAMRAHPELTLKILRSIRGFGRLSDVAASHHEKLDGTGYFRGLTAEQMPLESRILVVADIFDALTADRPYRAGMPLDKVHKILRSDAPQALDANCVEALVKSGIGCDQTFRDIYALQQHLSTENHKVELGESVLPDRLT